MVRMNRKRIVLELGFMLLVILLLSATIGKTLLAGQQPDLYSFAILHFAGYLFFLLMPVEVLVPYYLNAGHSAPAIFLLAVGTAIIAQLFDYFVGSLASNRIIHGLVGAKRYHKAENSIRRYGVWAILVFNMLPLSSPIIVLFAGMLQMRWWRVMGYSLAGLAIKYAVLVAVG